MNITIPKILIILFFSYYYANSIVRINELMPAPLDGEPEWIELYNYGNETVYISSPTISDLSSTRKIPDITLPSRTYLVIVKDTNLLKTYYNIPNDAILIQATFPALNNTTDAVVLKNSNGEILDSVYYDMNWGEKGISLERKNYLEPALTIDNWAASIDSKGGTPGFMNSTAFINFDIVCKNIELNNDRTELFISIFDEGKLPSEYFDIVLLGDTKFTNIQSEFMLIYSENNVEFIEREKTISVPVEHIRSMMTKSGEIEFIALVYSDKDERNINDTLRKSFYLRKEEPLIKINEIMYDVSGDFAEYIEIWNGGNDTLLLDNFVIWDAAGSITKGNVKIVSNSFKIPPDLYGVVTWDSSFFKAFPELIDKENVYYFKSSMNLNLAGDLVVLADASGKIYDSLTYDNKWHNSSLLDTKNKSLEKISPALDSHFPDNWSTCSDNAGGTPGEKNSLTGSGTLSGELSIIPNPFAPSLGGADANTVINYTLPFLYAYLNAAIYDLNGFRITQLANNRYTGKTGAFVWDGKNSDGFIVQSGQYVLLLESTDSESGRVFQQKAVVVVGR